MHFRWRRDIELAAGRLPSILFVAKRGHNYRHLGRIIRFGKPRARTCLRLAGRPGIPAGIIRLARNGPLPFNDMMAVHLARRRADRPWLFALQPIRFIYLALLHGYVAWLFATWLRRLKMDRPDAIVLWNGHRLPESAVKSAAEQLGICVIHVENGCLPNTRTLDARGVNANGSIPHDPAVFRMRDTTAVKREWTLVPRKLHRTKSPGSVTDDSLPERYAFAAFQVDTDSQIVLHSPHIRDMNEFYDMLEAALEKMPNRDLHIVLKEHPSSPYDHADLRARAMHHPRMHFRNMRNTQDLISGAETVITINSTCGVEGLLFGKRVVTLGEAFFNIDGLTRHATNADELAEALSDNTWMPDESVRRGLIDYLSRDYCVPMHPAANGEDDWQLMASRIVELCETTSSPRGQL